MKKNAIGSFYSNRSNNLFESAAAIVHHRQDVIDFFTNFNENKVLNLKQKSVLQDVQDENMMLMVSALAVVYVCVSGPFWVLLNSNFHHLDMYRHIQTITGHLEHISEGQCSTRCSVLSAFNSGDLFHGGDTCHKVCP